jgi:hypothetical protein
MVKIVQIKYQNTKRCKLERERERDKGRGEGLTTNFLIITRASITGILWNMLEIA